MNKALNGILVISMLSIFAGGFLFGVAYSIKAVSL